MGRAGRRPGATETRDEILAAARESFAESGFDGSTIRGIAARADVNPALIHHFFGTKQKLFVAALDFPFQPSAIADRIIRGPRQEVGERIVRTFLSVWNDATARASLLALVHSGLTNKEATAMFQQFISRTLLNRLTSALGVPSEQMIAALSQMLGLVLLRYVVRVEPLVSLDDEAIVRLVAPTIQRYMDSA